MLRFFKFLSSLGVCFTVLQLALQPAFAQVQVSAPPVLEWLRQANIPSDAAGIVVTAADGTGKTVAALNASQPFNPASVMKLYTTYGALELLGSAYTWKTQLLTTAKPQAGVLNGDVFIKGSGDPSLKLQDVWRLLRELRLQGIHTVTGNWVMDRSAFAADNADTFDFDGEGLRPYNVAPDALLMSFNTTRLAFKPLDAGWQVIADPLPLGWSVTGQVAAAAGACGDWRSKLQLQFKPSSSGGVVNGGAIHLGGSIAKACGTQELYRAIAPAQVYAAGLVKTLWAEMGGKHSGGFTYGTALGTTPTDAMVLADVESPALTEVIRDINKRSNNVMARMLYLNLARAPQATRAAAEARLRAWLGSAGLNDPSIVFDNGSGLSREERASPAALAKLLQYAYAGSLMSEFTSSLPVMAIDGTLARRMGPAAGMAHLKTGTLKDAASLAGYVLGASGKRYVLVGIVNHGNVGAARAVLDKLVAWVQQNG